MSVTTASSLLKEVERLLPDLDEQPENPLLEEIRKDPVQLMSFAGMTPDPWQKQILRTDSSQLLMLCSRQSGKSQIAAALALTTALLEPSSLILIVSPTERQSIELLQEKLMPLYRALGRPLATLKESVMTVRFQNGSRIVALPGKEGNIRSYSAVNLMLIDEASRVPDPLYYAVRPMLAVSRGRLLALSTPWGKRGWFWEKWESKERWERIKVTADQCPRITKEFLAQERTSNPLMFSQEFECRFLETIDAVFREEDIQAAMSNSIQPMFGAQPLFARG